LIVNIQRDEGHIENAELTRVSEDD
jgi:hypothetical protein